MVTHRKGTSLTLVVAAAAIAFAGLVSPLSAQLAKGGTFPALDKAGLSGDLPQTEGKVTLVDFWASWCAPCKASFPAYSRIQQDYAPRGLVIVAVSVDEDPANYATFIAKHKPLFPTVLDLEHKLVAEVEVPTMPTSYLMDRTGKVRFVHTGFHGDSTERELRAEIGSLLDEKSPAP